ncbi:hypothetical protein RRF57_010642 [Xylaria bambusicola]|uniref:Uncharacterized protein n=1 Tax=Xylaria bambusicola TaxID=326684 RepID=A0AAN7ULJ4_9PEZI
MEQIYPACLENSRLEKAKLDSPGLRMEWRGPSEISQSSPSPHLYAMITIKVPPLNHLNDDNPQEPPYIIPRYLVVTTVPSLAPLTGIRTVSPGTISTRLSSNLTASSSDSTATPLTGTSALTATLFPSALKSAFKCFGFCRCRYFKGSGQFT